MSVKKYLLEIEVDLDHAQCEHIRVEKKINQKGIRWMCDGVSKEALETLVVEHIEDCMERLPVFEENLDAGKYDRCHKAETAVIVDYGKMTSSIGGFKYSEPGLDELKKYILKDKP